jgi:heme ABC exporter ATP-binding subunit CcmA
MLRAEALRHAYGPVWALDGITFSLQPGRTLVIFGPNGAGKTTLLKTLAGLIRPASGAVQIDGGRRAIGWIGHQTHLYNHLTVRENLLFWASLYDVPAAERERRADRLMAQLGLADRANQPVQALSRGLAQRATIARALVHEPTVLLLDEPFTGLDLAAAGDFRRLLVDYAAAGRSVVIATHNVEEGAELASEIAFQVRGKFVEHAPRARRGAAEIAEAYRRAVGHV